jgi:hypothetical protein
MPISEASASHFAEGRVRDAFTQAYAAVRSLSPFVAPCHTATW